MIKNIIFDFGDIFIDLDKTASIKYMEKFGLTVLTATMDQMNKSYERGLLSTEEFVTFYANEFPNASKNELISAWNAIILDFPEYRLKFIELLANQKGFRLFLLSNTNELHIEKVIANMDAKRYERFKNCFEKFYLSHEIKLRKPDTEIFEYVLNENKLNAYETLFIDDTEENTIAAATLGIKTWHLIPGVDDIIHLFNKKTLLS